MSLLAPGQAVTYQQHVQNEVCTLGEGLGVAVTPVLQSAEIYRAFEEFEQQSLRLPETTMVPTHNEPNNKNFLLAGDRMYIIDWDDIVLSDPLRDTGLLLWWYVPERKWHEFFTTFDQPLNESTLQRIYWWGARASLRVALWYDRKHDDQAVGAFVTDFLAVLHRRQNPHAPFNHT